jgi:RND family efflux transporter MFP subunit
MESTQRPPYTQTRRASEPVRPLAATEEESRPQNGHNGHSEDGHESWGTVKKARSAWVIVAAMLGFLVMAALFALGFIPRMHTNAELNADAEAAASGPIPVSTVVPTRAAQTLDLSLPGTLRPWQEVSIFARSTGYLKKWYVDISQPVKKGQLMAEIESPEVDQQLLQARAALLQMNAAQVKAQSDVQITQTTYNRYVALKGTSGVTEQDIDQKAADLSAAQANLEAAKANVTAGQANVQRLVELQLYQKVTAPFDGVVTGRAYDTGALINADPTSADIKPMYKIAENDVLRVFVNVPQSSSLTIKRGMDVSVVARERPGRTFVGKVMGTTNYLDPNNRSLLTEIKVPNEDGALLPGMFVDAKFKLIRDNPPLVIPAPALIVNAQGTQVAVVQENTIHFRKVQIGEDYGNTLEITGGLQGDEQIISTPGEKIVEGANVSIVNAQPNASPQNPGQKSEKVAEAGK